MKETSLKFKKPTINETITTKMVREFVKYIEEIQGDSELAHVREDDLYVSVLRSIANDKCENPRECCKEALKTSQFDFSRHCS